MAEMVQAIMTKAATSSNVVAHIQSVFHTTLGKPCVVREKSVVSAVAKVVSMF